MAGMGGMDMSSNGLFTGTNEAVAHGFWYGIASVVGMLTLVRVFSAIQSRQRRRLTDKDPYRIPSRPNGMFSQAYATATATMRELAYPQPYYFTGKIAKYFSPIPVGRWLILAVYWIMVLVFLWSNTILKPKDPMYAYKWEKVGFRAGWVSMTQIPFIHLLSCKFNPISISTGISYERLNWLHRWAARTVFLTAIVHWSFFLREWWLADMIKLELQMMPMVKYGFGAFGVICWMILSGFGFFRAASYELFVAQHICAAAVLLWLLFSHVPVYARYNVWMSIGFVAFDWTVRIVWGVLQNTHLLGGPALRSPGYAAHLEPLAGDMVRLTIDDADFAWRAGQHVYLSIPRLRPFEVHPFTIANAAQHGDSRSLTLLIKAHSGFSKSLHRAAVRSAETSTTYRAFLSGPWGIPPDLLHYETVVLVACASGASFIMPILEDIMEKQGCIRNVTLHWIVRSEEHFAWCGELLTSLVRVKNAQCSKVSLQATVHVTQPVTRMPKVKDAEGVEPMVAVDSRSEDDSTTASVSTLEDEKAPLSREPRHAQPQQSVELKHSSRPTVGAMIRPPVEAALGETAVVVCGGLSITAQARNFVAAMSDERAVHKGTGAQGIFLFTETYGW
ncbi:hypothetical protein LTR08_001535 [Meristemomyces frigidus]|nr:hypothetical protein LTR08_001535 [Meristemomyces frigidus]